MTALFLAFVSALLIGAYEVARKAAVMRDAPERMLVTATCTGALALAPALVFSLASPDRASALGVLVRWPTAHEHLLVAAKSALVSGVWVCAYEAVRHLPLSVAAPLRATAPVLTLVGAVVLYGERPAPAEWVGIAIILVGYLGFAWLGPKEGLDYLRSPWIALLGLGLILSAASGLYDKYLLQTVELPPTTLQFWFLAYGTLLQSVILVWRERGRTAPRFRVERIAVLAGVLLVLADQFYLRALAIPGSMVSLIALVRRASVLVSFTLGGIVFREKLLRQKAVPLALILVGVGLLLVE